MRSDSWLSTCNDPHHKQFGELSVDAMCDIIESRNLHSDVINELMRRGHDRGRKLNQVGEPE